MQLGHAHVGKPLLDLLREGPVQPDVGVDRFA